MKGAIFASIGLTALQVPNMYDVHWSARALCASSMVLGILSVSTATSQYRSMAQLNDSLSLRLWLSRGRPTPYLTQLPSFILEKFADKPAHKQQEFGKYSRFPVFEKLPLESSVSALKAVSLPRHLLDLAVLLFLVGFALYYLLLWLENVGDSSIASRNVFIVFVITVGLVGLYIIMLDAFQISNEDKKEKEFELETLQGGRFRSDAIKELEKELDRCQTMLKFMRDVEEESAPSSHRPSGEREKQDGSEQPVDGAEA